MAQDANAITAILDDPGVSISHFSKNLEHTEQGQLLWGISRI
jgi:hypothetical protein